jgi:DNA-binding MarR family transcriptional regulator
MKALAFCLEVAQAQARLRRKLDDELGTWHGLSYEDFVLLSALERAEGGRLTAAGLASPLGIQPSSVLRIVLALEKTGLVQREPDAAGRRWVVLRKPGRQLLGEAAENAEAICRKALASLAPEAMGVASSCLAALAGSAALELR